MEQSRIFLLRAIIFDLDNCLIRSTIDFKKIKLRLLQMLHEENPNVENTRLGNSDFDIQSLSIGQLLARIKRLSSTKHHQALKLVEEEELKGVTGATPMPCSQKILDFLKQFNLKIGLLTNNNHVNTSFALKKFCWEEYFDHVITRDDVTEMKPSPEGLLRFLTSWKLKPREILYVGDSWIDESAAAACDVNFVGIRRKWQPGSYHSKKTLGNSIISSRILWIDELCMLRQLLVPKENDLFFYWQKEA